MKKFLKQSILVLPRSSFSGVWGGHWGQNSINKNAVSFREIVPSSRPFRSVK